MVTEKGYNGWTNYETWVINVWIGNDRGSHDYWKERTKEVLSQWNKAPMNGPVGALELAEVLKDVHEAEIPELKGFAADLMNSALGEVNWYEIAVSLIESQ